MKNVGRAAWFLSLLTLGVSVFAQAPASTYGGNILPAFEWPSVPAVIRLPELRDQETWGGYVFGTEGLFIARYRDDGENIVETAVLIVDPATGAVLSTRPIDEGFTPRALAVTDRAVFVQSSNRIYAYDRRTLVLRDETDLRSFKPNPDWSFRGMATADGETFYLAFREDNAVYRYVRSSRSFTRWCELPPNAAPRAVAMNGRGLFAVDAFHQLIYSIDTAAGRIVNEIAFSRWSGYDPVSFFNGTLYMYDGDASNLRRFPFQVLNGSIVRSDPTRVRVTARLVLTNTSRTRAATGIRCVIGVPIDGVHQTITSLAFQGPAQPAREADRYGSPMAVFDVWSLAAGAEITVGWTAEAVVYTTHYRIDPASLRPLSELPSGLAVDYLSATAPNLSLNDPDIVRLAQSIAGADLVGRVRATRDAVWDRVTYEIDDNWDDAAAVLRRGTGSCSEYSYLTASLLRRLGYPVRFVGSTINRSLEPRTDDTYHRWIEVYLPGFGWAPMDANHNDSDEGSPYSNQLVFGEDLGALIVSRGGSEDGNYLGSSYIQSVQWSSGSLDEEISFDWEILED